MLDTDERLARPLAVAYRYLNPRERTRAEVRAHLERADIDPREIERTIDTLAANGHLDDARFARLLSHDKRELEGWGSERIRQVLLTRGIDPDLIEEALAEDHPGDERDRALALLRRRFPSPPSDRRDRDRALGVLLRKGFDSELAVDAIAAYARDAGGH